MVADMFSSPSKSDIYATTPAAASATCPPSSLGAATGSNCTLLPLSDTSNEAWYNGSWTNPAAWLVIVYCVASTCVFLLLMCHGYLDCHLNLDFSHAAAVQREMRRRRRNGRRMEHWLEIERREAGEVETDMDEEDRRGVHPEWPVYRPRESFAEQEQPPTLYAGLDAMQRETMYERQMRDARVLARLERAGLF